MTALATAPSPVRSGRDTLRLVFDPVGADRRAAEDCEADVFADRFGETKEHLDRSFVGYEDATVFLALIDGQGVAVASARLIVASGAGLKTAEYMAGAPWGMDPARSMSVAGLDPSSTWDVATLSVRRRSRESGALWTAGLCHGLFQVARANSVSATVALMDEVARERLSSVGIVYDTLPGGFAAPFDGSPASTPVYAGMQTMIDNQRRDFPDAYRLITLGVGLDGIELPSFSGFRLSRSVDLREAVVLPARWGVSESLAS